MLRRNTMEYNVLQVKILPMNECVNPVTLNVLQHHTYESKTNCVNKCKLNVMQHHTYESKKPCISKCK